MAELDIAVVLAPPDLDGPPAVRGRRATGSAGDERSRKEVSVVRAQRTDVRIRIGRTELI